MEVVKNTSLVKVFKGVPSVSHYVIAEYSKNDKDSIARLIRAHKQDFETFGSLNYELQEVKAGKGISRRKIYWLNEQQSYLLLTYLKNTKEVREFKIKLINEYFLLRNSATPPQNCPADQFDSRIAGYKGMLARKNKEIERLRFELAIAKDERKRAIEAAKYFDELYEKAKSGKNYTVMLEHNLMDLAASYARLKEELIGRAEMLEFVAKELKSRVATVDHFIEAIGKILPKAKDVADSAGKRHKKDVEFHNLMMKRS